MVPAGFCAAALPGSFEQSQLMLTHPLHPCNEAVLYAGMYV